MKVDKTNDEILKDAEKLAAMDLIHASYNKNGVTAWDNKKIQTINPDFVLVQGIEANIALKKNNEKLNILRDLLTKNNFLIEFKCE